MQHILIKHVIDHAKDSAELLNPGLDVARGFIGTTVRHPHLDLGLEQPDAA